MLHLHPSQKRTTVGQQQNSAMTLKNSYDSVLHDYFARDWPAVGHGGNETADAEHILPGRWR
jgi:hypothetical protein